MPNGAGLLSKWNFHLGMANTIRCCENKKRRIQSSLLSQHSSWVHFDKWMFSERCLDFQCKDFQEENTASFVEGGRGGAGLNFTVRKQLLSELFRSAITAYKVVVMKMQQITMDYPPPFVCIFIVKDLLWHSASKRRIKAVCNVCRIAFSLSL